MKASTWHQDESLLVFFHLQRVTLAYNYSLIIFLQKEQTRKQIYSKVITAQRPVNLMKYFVNGHKVGGHRCVDIELIINHV